MIEYLGLVYDFLKDAKSYLNWDEESKIVDKEWLTKSGFKTKAIEDGLALRWTSPQKLERRKSEGYKILYERDELRRIRRRLVLNDGSVLMGKKN